MCNVDPVCLLVAYRLWYMCGGSVGSVCTVQCICVEGMWVVYIQYSVYVWRECG